MNYMWADTLQLAERGHLLRLLGWAAACILTGTSLLAWLRVGGRRSDIITHFAIQTAAWGVVNASLALVGLGRVQPRDVAAATRLDRLLWLNIGLDAGYVLVGLALAITGWLLSRRLKLVGAGIGVVVQGSALVLLDLLLALQISR